MAAASSSSRADLNAGGSHPNNDLIREVKKHEVAITELKALHASRPVYLKNCNIFFRTTIQKATTSEQRNLDMARNKLQKLNSETK